MKTSQMRVLLMTAAFSLLALAASAVIFPCGTHLVKGTLRNALNQVESGEADVIVRAVNARGIVIAEAHITTVTAEGYNFLLEIPLSTTATDRTCAVGDQLNCVLITPDGLEVGLSPIVVGGANKPSELTLRLLNVKTYVDEKNKRTAEVPVEYLDAIQPWIDDEEAIADKTYDPWADYDGDGFINYHEFIAGTNPFDDSDKLDILSFKITDFGIDRTKMLGVLKFEYVGGHVYAVNATPTLVNPAWAARPARLAPEDEDQAQFIPSTDPSDIGIATIYLVHPVNATNEFFRVEAK